MHTFHPAARWSGFLKGISISVSVLLLGALVVIGVVMPAATPWPLRLAVMLVPPATVLVAALFVVRGYAWGDGTLYVRRLLWTTRVPLGALREARIDPQAGAGSLRLFGNGGLFVFAGWFRNARLGRYRAFVTDWQRATVLRADTGTVLLSPADPAGFVRALQAGMRSRKQDKPRPRWRQSR